MGLGYVTPWCVFILHTYYTIINGDDYHLSTTFAKGGGNKCFWLYFLYTPIPEYVFIGLLLQGRCVVVDKSGNGSMCCVLGRSGRYPDHKKYV